MTDAAQDQDAATEPTLFSQWPHVTYKLASFDTAGYGTEGEDRVIGPLAESNIVTSEISGHGSFAGQHTVAIDLDVPAVLVPSSTPGHSHLYIDAPMPWSIYAALLKALADGGVIEPGYEGASANRKHTSLRLPWVRKPALPFGGDQEAPF